MSVGSGGHDDRSEAPLASPALDDEGGGMLRALSEGAQRALRERPSFSIRARLGLGFLLWLFLSLGVTVASLVILARIETKIDFIEAAASYTIEIQDARRYEKNFFLYGSNLNDAILHVGEAARVLETEGRNMSNAVGSENYGKMARHLGRYEELLQELEEPTGGDAGDRERLAAIEAELREHGAVMVRLAEELVAKERRAVDSMLKISRRIPLTFLVVLVLLVVYLAIFITRQMLAPLHRMLLATRRIAEGDFTPITPRRKYKDEFSELAMAMNHMMSELARRQDLLVQTHKLKAVGTLTAGVAHELNNPLNNIVLTASMLLEDYGDLPDDERLDMIRDLVDQSERAQKIVRNLLDFARETEMDAQTLHVRDIVERTLQLAANQIKIAKVKVHCLFSPNLPPVLGDHQRLAQVFLNIVLNALHAMSKGGRLEITVRNTPDRDFIAVAFADSGPGIPEHLLGSIFDPFFSTKSRGKGTGLGLSVSLGIVQKHGGDIQVRSKHGQGTTFTVVLPIAKVPARMDPLD